MKHLKATQSNLYEHEPKCFFEVRDVVVVACERFPSQLLFFSPFYWSEVFQLDKWEDVQQKCNQNAM